MLRKILLTITLVAMVVMLNSCAKTKPEAKFTGAKGEVKIITLDPGHFHAALIQKIMYDQVSPVVHVYAPQGPDVADHLKRVEGFNTRADDFHISFIYSSLLSAELGPLKVGFSGTLPCSYSIWI